jgi:hypothetical protein
VTNPRIAFALHLSEMLNHYLPVMQHLPAPVTLVNCARTGSAEFRRIQERSAEHGYAHVTITEAKNEPFDALVSNQMHVTAWENETTPGLLALAKTQVRLCYALGKTEWNLADWNKFYDLILCYGPYQQRLFKHGFPGTQVEAIGYPRFDRFFAKDNGVKALKSQFAHDAKKQNIVWLPTYNTLSSIPAFAAAISALSAQYNVWVKLHPGTPAQEPERMALLQSLPFTALFTDDFDNIPLFALADVVLADYGGSAFGAIYTDKNLLLLNTHGDLLAPDTGWLSADIQLRDAFANVNPEDVEQLPDLLANASLWKKQKPLRAKYRSLLFSDKNGESGKAAAQAILGFVATAKKTRKKQVTLQKIPDNLLAFEPSTPPKGYDWHGFYIWVKKHLQLAGTEAASAQRDNTKLRTEIQAMQDDVAAYRNEMTALQVQHASALAALQTTLADEQQQRATIISERENLDQQLGMQLQLTETLRSNLATEKKISEKLRSDLNEEKGITETLQMELEIEKTSSKMLRAGVAAGQQRFEEQMRVSEQLRHDIVNEHNKLEAVKTALTEATSHIQKLAKQHELGEEALAALQQAFAETTARLDRIQHRLEVRVFGKLRQKLWPYKHHLAIWWRSRHDKTPQLSQENQQGIEKLDMMTRIAFDDARIASLLEQALDSVLLSSVTVSGLHETRLLVLCHDELDLMDRRVLLQTEVWRKRGYEVVIICMTSKHATVVEKILEHGEKAIGIPVATNTNLNDPLWAEHVVLGDFNAKNWVSLKIESMTEWLRSRIKAHPKLSCFIKQHIVTGTTLGFSWYPMPFTVNYLNYAKHYPSRYVLACDLPALPAGAQLKKIWGAKLLYDAHELYPEQVAFDQKQHYVLKAWENWGLPYCDLAYTVSKSFAREMQRIYKLPVPPRVISNAAGFHVPSRKTNPLREIIGVSEDHFIFLYHGGFSLHRNLETMIAGYALTNIPNSSLVMLGYGDKPYFSELIKKSGRSDIYMLDAVPQSELAAWVMDANIVLIPYPPVDLNTRYCSPNKLFDCIALGVPVMVNDGIENVGNILKEYSIGYAVPMGEAQAIANSFAVVRDAKQPPKENFERAEAEYGWSAQQRILSEWITEVAS